MNVKKPAMNRISKILMKTGSTQLLFLDALGARMARLCGAVPDSVFTECFHTLLVVGSTEKLGAHSAQVCCVMWEGPLGCPLTEGPRGSLAPPCLTEFLCPKHLRCLLAFSQFSIRLVDESPTRSWPEDQPKSPKNVIFRIVPSLETKALVQSWSRCVRTPVPLGWLLFLLLFRLPAGLATWESDVSIALITFITVGPHLLRAKAFLIYPSP